MSISSFSPRRLASGAAAASNSRLTKLLDWAMAIGFAAYAAYLVAGQWPAPDTWTCAVAAMAAVGIFLAAYDWKSRMRALMAARMRSRFTRRRS